MSFPAIRYSKVSPSFLSANSTSHTWPFSAIAELIDNAYDPGVAATQINIEVRTIQNEKCLVFLDNGSGMTPDELYRMLSFGFSDKKDNQGHLAIGKYGNGFKSGSMRLGKDVIVFTCRNNVVSVGLLSQTYLAQIRVETVLVPIVSFSLPDFRLLKQNDEVFMNLEHITKYSLFRSPQCLKIELEEITKTRNSGTKIIIYNLKRDHMGNYELDTASTSDDILNPETVVLDRSTMTRPMAETLPTYRKSLKTYLSFLYFKPRMKINLRRSRIKTYLVAKSLKDLEHDCYNPHWLEHSIILRFGFSPSQNPEDYGALLYHKNRLIKAYEKVGCQKLASGQGAKVVAIVEANFLEPNHNKQDFIKDEKYNAFMGALANKLKLYYNVKTNTDILDDPPVPKTKWNWVQCEKCLKWRRLMDSVSPDSLPDRWYCLLNYDAAHNRCEIPEEPEDEDDVLIQKGGYSKRYREHQEEVKRKAKEEELKAKEATEKALQRKVAMLEEREKESVGRIDIIKARKALVNAHKRDKEQTELITKLRLEKEKLEKEHENAVKIAENLVVRQLESDNTEPGETLKRKGTPRPSTKSNKRRPILLETDAGTVFVTENEPDSIDLTKDAENDDDVIVVSKSNAKHSLQNGSSLRSPVLRSSKPATVTSSEALKQQTPTSSNSLAAGSNNPPNNELDYPLDPLTPVVYTGPQRQRRQPSSVQQGGSQAGQAKNSNVELSKNKTVETRRSGKSLNTSPMVVDLFKKKKSIDITDDNGHEEKPVIEDLHSSMNVSVPSGAEVNGGVSETSMPKECDEVVAPDTQLPSDSHHTDSTFTANDNSIHQHATRSKTASSKEPLQSSTQSSSSIVNMNEDSMCTTVPETPCFNPAHSDKDFSVKETQTEDHLNSSGQTLERINELSHEVLLRNIKIESLEETISDLRNDVISLLNIIVPDLQIENLNKVDAFVKEIIRVNKGEDVEDENLAVPAVNEETNGETGSGEIVENGEDHDASSIERVMPEKDEENQCE